MPLVKNTGRGVLQRALAGGVQGAGEQFGLQQLLPLLQEGGMGGGGLEGMDIQELLRLLQQLTGGSVGPTMNRPLDEFSQNLPSSIF